MAIFELKSLHRSHSFYSSFCKFCEEQNNEIPRTPKQQQTGNSYHTGTVQQQKHIKPARDQEVRVPKVHQLHYTSILPLTREFVFTSIS